MAATSTIAALAQAVGAHGAGQGEASATMAGFYIRGVAGFTGDVCGQWSRAQLGDNCGPHPSVYDINGGRQLVGGRGAPVAPPARVRPHGPTMDRKQKKKRKGERKKKAVGARILFHRCSLSSTGCNRSVVFCGLISPN